MFIKSLNPQLTDMHIHKCTHTHFAQGWSTPCIAHNTEIMVLDALLDDTSHYLCKWGKNINAKKQTFFLNSLQYSVSFTRLDKCHHYNVKSSWTGKVLNLQKAEQFWNENVRKKVYTQRGCEMVTVITQIAKGISWECLNVWIKILIFGTSGMQYDLLPYLVFKDM